MLFMHFIDRKIKIAREMVQAGQWLSSSAAMTAFAQGHSRVFDGSRTIYGTSVRPMRKCVRVQGAQLSKFVNVDCYVAR